MHATSGLLYQLGSVSWDWFGTLTFGMRKVPIDQSQPDLLEKGKKFNIVGCRVPSAAVRYSMFFQWLRQQERHWQQKKTEWVLRHEKGEIGGRPHFHFLIRALPPGANTSHYRMAAMSRWESLGGGMARIRRFDNAEHGGEKDAVSYVLKNLGANAYELAKFERDEFDSIRISDALIASLTERSQRITV
ncbi:hypothetical protein TSACC_3325 [Terrimicrobium sacchariphilum]|uniref:Replication protein n=1 Tax=Terrimicrobium sacchariphilum TaxID=690879 RepID=A0A146GD32_TERSA|nr:hypothetical protein [Terrimicrobium sacchariphilum]GAT35261.1 hypothetical protein TSACC_3325 [Terrimicrobium sacchariphilum]